MRELQLRVGDVHELALAGRGTAGYSWDADVIGPEGVVEIGRLPSGPEQAANPSGPPVSGSIPERLELRAVGSGRVQVRLTLRRSWETEMPPLEEETLDIRVKA